MENQDREVMRFRLPLPARAFAAIMLAADQAWPGCLLGPEQDGFQVLFLPGKSTTGK